MLGVLSTHQHLLLGQMPFLSCQTVFFHRTIMNVSKYCYKLCGILVIDIITTTTCADLTQQLDKKLTLCQISDHSVTLLVQCEITQKRCETAK